MLKKSENSTPKKNKKNSVVSVRLCNAAISRIEAVSPSPKRGFKGGAAQWVRDLVYEKLGITNIHDEECRSVLDDDCNPKELGFDPKKDVPGQTFFEECKNS
jgi:hypothetical protein